MAARRTPSDLPAWLRDAAPYEPPAAAALPVQDRVDFPAVPSADDAGSPRSVTGREPELDRNREEDVTPGGAEQEVPSPDVDRATGEEQSDPAFTSKLVHWSRHAATGAVLAGIAGGLQRVFEPDERPGIVMEVPAPAPDDTRPVRLVFVPGDPKASIAFVRPWLLRSGWPPRG